MTKIEKAEDYHITGEPELKIFRSLKNQATT